MRSVRRFRQLHGFSWLLCAAVSVVAGLQWHAHLRVAERRAEEAER
jgi:hypothetical protein